MSGLRKLLALAAVLFAGSAFVAVGVAQEPKKPDEPKKEEPKKPDEPKKPEEPKKPVDPPKVDPPAPSADKVKFEAKFEAGKAFYQQVTTDVDQTVRVTGGTELKLKHTQTFLFAWTPVKLEADKWTVKLKIEGIKLRVDVSGNPVNYDSTAENADAKSAGLNEFFKNLKDAEFTVTFGKGMAVEKVEGAEALLKNLGAANQQMEALLKKILSDAALKEMCDPLAGLTPADGKEKDAKVPAESKWTKLSTLKLGPIGDYDRSLEFTFKGPDAEKKDLMRVEVKPTLTYKPPTAEPDGLLFRIKSGELTTAAGEKPGFYLYDPAKGRVVKSELAVKMGGNLVVAIGTTETTVTLAQTQTTTIDTADTSFLPKK